MWSIEMADKIQPQNKSKHIFYILLCLLYILISQAFSDMPLVESYYSNSC